MSFYAPPLAVRAAAGAGRARSAAAGSRAADAAFAMRFPAVPTFVAALGTRPDWRRHFPVAGTVAAACGARDRARAPARDHRRCRSGEASLMLVLDRSGSMDANDVQPSRLLAAEKAANTFINQLPTRRASAWSRSRARRTRSIARPPITSRRAARSTRRPPTAPPPRATRCRCAEPPARAREADQRPPRDRAAVRRRRQRRPGPDLGGEPRRSRTSRSTRWRWARHRVAAEPHPFGPPVAVPPDPQLMQQIARTSHGRSFSAEDADGLISIYKGLGTQLGSKTSRPTSRSRSPQPRWRSCWRPEPAHCVGADACRDETTGN